MKTISFNNFKDFAHKIKDKYHFLADDDKAIAVIAKYEEARQIIKELLCIGCHIHSIISLEDPEFTGYVDEYIITMTNIDEEYEIWCEPMKRENDYITDDSPITYILANCSSKVIPYCEGKNVYEVSISDNSDEEHDYVVNGNKVDKETFDDYVSKFIPDKVSEDNDENDSSTYNITIKGNLDMGDAEKIIEDMERRMTHMQEMMNDMNPFRRLFLW